MLVTAKRMHVLRSVRLLSGQLLEQLSYGTKPFMSCSSTFFHNFEDVLAIRGLRGQICIEIYHQLGDRRRVAPPAGVVQKRESAIAAVVYDSSQSLAPDILPRILLRVVEGCAEGN